MDRELNTVVARRTTALYGVVLLIGFIVIARLFYLQVVRHDYYRNEALAEHESKFSIPADRGSIYALDGENKTPLVLNEVLPTVYVDPQGIDDSENDTLAQALSDLLKIDKQEVLDKLSQNESRYQVIKKQISRVAAEKLSAMELNGVGLADESYRVYPQKTLGAQMLGFVNGEGDGQYGVEGFLNDDLKGKDGRFEAVTDVYGIPLTTSEDNVIEQPQDGQDITLTIDVNVQAFVEQALAKGVKAAGAKTGSAVVIDPKTGAIRAMANYPSYNPAKYTEVTDFSLFQNNVVSAPYEAGSVIKVLTMSAALNEGAVTPNTSYYDAGFVQVDDRRIENAGSPGGINRNMKDVIQHSVNTGVVFALKQLGGGEIDLQARKTFYDYLTNKYGFGSVTGIAQSNEGEGLLYGPETQEGNNVRYANMTFGQGMTVTMLQAVSAVAAVVNGGDYYQPYIVDSTTSSDGVVTVNEPQIIRPQIISQETSKQIREMMVGVVQGGGGYIAQRQGYTIGGKTGTSQVLDENGEYSDTREVGSFVGFGGGKDVEYVIMTRVDEPTIAGYAGTAAAAPIFADISNYLIDYYQIPPR
jgi:cell division protein FtsI/penicillin-binding protein 2